MSRIFRGISMLIPALLAVCMCRWPAYGDASFVNPAPTLAIATHVSSIGQTIEDSLDIPLNHDSACSLSITSASPGDEQLHNGPASLSTFYKLTGAALLNPDSNWVASGTFVSQSYTIPGTGPLDHLTLWARATTPVNSAPDAGLYSASVIITVTW